MHQSIKDRLNNYQSTSIDEARALPLDMYTSTRLFDDEMENIFRQDWICVGRLDQVQKPGDYFTIDIAGEPLVVARGEDDELRALSAVCRHRYMAVVSGSGNASRFICPYHRWVYGNDGMLRSAPHMAKPVEADGSACRLPEFHIETWLGFIFVSLAEQPAAFAPQMEGAYDIMAPYQMESWRTAVAYDDIWSGNWKMGIETGLEGYHIEGLHPNSFAGLMTSKGCTFQAAGGLWNSYRIDINLDHPLGVQSKPYAERMGGDDLTSAPTLSIYPNTNISCSQGNANWLTFMPINPGETRVIGGFLVPPDEYERLRAEPEELELTGQLINAINNEDASAMIDLQKNVKSRAAKPGQLNIREEPLLYFYRYLSRRLGGVGS
ncbi:MAG: aromatic ring-hydroxylating dioxygenase subunit alpha [Parasphingorhabdus sp.]